MTSTSDPSFVPLLTVMPDYGNAPFLWLVDNPDRGGIGGNLCDGTYWDECLPLSEGLWRKFADWAIEFDRTAFYSFDFEDDDWDWIAFHARGLQLARWLKEEIGTSHRVVYAKPFEDPNHRVDERTEILIDGSLASLPPLPSSVTEPARFCRKIVSGGQTGADRGALDFAMMNGYPHAGWAPQGREAEDGRIPMKYQLTELTEGGYRQRCKRNVQDSDGTLIVNLGELDSGTLATKNFAVQMRKPSFVLQLDSGPTRELASIVIEWLRPNAIDTLNVAGPRESKRPGIHRLTVELLEAVDADFRLETAAARGKSNAR